VIDFEETKNRGCFVVKQNGYIRKKYYYPKEDEKERIKALRKARRCDNEKVLELR
jgi:hypothetical protein